MILKEQNILFFTRTMGIGGTENVILQLCEILNPLVHKIVVCSCGGIHVDKLNDMGINHYEISDIEDKSPVTVFNILKILNKVIREEKITVVHTHHRMAAFYTNMLQPKYKYIFINTSHNVFYNKRILTRFAFQQAHLISCGQMVRQNLVEYFKLPEQQITVIYNAVKDFDGPNIQNDFIQSLRMEGNFMIGNIGRLSEQKGMEYYLKSIPIILKRCPHVRFFIIGSGEDERKLKNFATANNLDPFLFFLGFQPDVQNIISQLDLVVLSSLWEGLPLIPIEVFSVKKTIVATSVDGTKEIIEDGKSGLLVAPKDAEQLAEKVIWMIEHLEERKQMEQNAFEMYNKKFTMNRFAQDYIAYYEAI